MGAQAQASRTARELRQAAHDEIELSGSSTGDNAAASQRINAEIREPYRSAQLSNDL